MAYEIKEVTLQREDSAIVRFRCAPGQAAGQLGPAYGEIGGYLHSLGVPHENTKVYARFLELAPEQHVEAGFTVARPIEPKGRVEPGELPAFEAVMTRHVGPYQGLIGAGQALRDWMAANRREPSGGLWEVYVSDPEETPADELVTEVYYPLKPIRTSS
jgi:effector-binding domain-containing protein